MPHQFNFYKDGSEIVLLPMKHIGDPGFYIWVPDGEAIRVPNLETGRQTAKKAHAYICAAYGYTEDGDPIVAPKDWKIIPFNKEIPQIHREYDAKNAWLEPRRCHSTMTPWVAHLFGNIRAYATPIAP